MDTNKKNTVKKANIIDIPLTQIDKNPENEKIFNMSEIQYLAEGIKEEGFFGAIEVYRTPDGRYEISAGHRRYEAAKLLGMKTIPCIVKEMPDDLTRGKKLLTSNLRNRKLTPMDMANAIAYYERLLKEAGDHKNFKEKATKFFNISPAQLYRFQCLSKLIPELQEMANDPQFPFSAFREAAELNEDGQKELYRQLSLADKWSRGADKNDRESRLTRSKIERIISNLRDVERFCAKVSPKKKEQQKRESLQRQMNPVEDRYTKMLDLPNAEEDLFYEQLIEMDAPRLSNHPSQNSKTSEGVIKAISLTNMIIERSERIKMLNKSELSIFIKLLEEALEQLEK